MGVIAEFKVQEERKGNKMRTKLIIHGKTVAASEWHNLMDKTYEKLFDAVKNKLKLSGMSEIKRSKN